MKRLDTFCTNNDTQGSSYSVYSHKIGQCKNTKPQLSICLEGMSSNLQNLCMSSKSNDMLHIIHYFHHQNIHRSKHTICSLRSSISSRFRCIWYIKWLYLHIIGSCSCSQYSLVDMFLACRHNSLWRSGPCLWGNLCTHFRQCKSSTLPNKVCTSC